jgi:hypothetical protein
VAARLRRTHPHPTPSSSYFILQHCISASLHNNRAEKILESITAKSAAQKAIAEKHPKLVRLYGGSGGMKAGESWRFEIPFSSGAFSSTASLESSSSFFRLDFLSGLLFGFLPDRNLQSFDSR